MAISSRDSCVPRKKYLDRILKLAKESKSHIKLKLKVSEVMGGAKGAYPIDGVL